MEVSDCLCSFLNEVEFAGKNEESLHTDESSASFTHYGMCLSICLSVHLSHQTLVLCQYISCNTTD